MRSFLLSACGRVSAGSMPTAACSTGEPKTDRKVRSAKASLMSRHASRAATICRDTVCSSCEEGIVRSDRLAILPHLIGQRLHGSHQRICVGEELVLKPKRMQLPQSLGRRGRHCGAHERLSERPVEGKIDLGHARRRCESALVVGIIAAERPDVVERSRLAAHDPLAGNEVGAGCRCGLRLEHRLVESGRQDVDQVDVARRTRRAPCGQRPPTRRCPGGRRTRGSCRRSSARASGFRRRRRRGRESSRAPAAAA